MKPIFINTIETTPNGNVRIHLASTASNDDWMRAARLLRQKKRKEFEELDNTKMFYDADQKP